LYALDLGFIQKTLPEYYFLINIFLSRLEDYL